LPNIGNPTPLHLEYAVKLRDALPENVKAAAREPLDAVALIYAMLLSDDEKLRATQIAEIGKRSRHLFRIKPPRCFPTFQKSPRTSICPSSIWRWANCGS
jgi:hypothetical protein